MQFIKAETVFLREKDPQCLGILVTFQKYPMKYLWWSHFSIRQLFLRASLDFYLKQDSANGVSILENFENDDFLQLVLNSLGRLLSEYFNFSPDRFLPGVIFCNVTTLIESFCN